MRLQDYAVVWNELHKHGLSEPGWLEHVHAGGTIPHRHDPETMFQVTLCEGRTLLGDPCAKDLAHEPPCSKIPGEGIATVLELAAYTDMVGMRDKS